MGQSCSQANENGVSNLGPKSRFLTMKGCSGPMEEVIRAYRCRTAEERIQVLRMELDYELAKLYEAMKEKSTHKIDQCKARLKEIRREMMILEVL
jgi:hypothetical protein